MFAPVGFMRLFDVKTRGDLNLEHHRVLSGNQRQFINKSVRSVIADLSETIGEPESVNKFLHKSINHFTAEKCFFFRAQMLFPALLNHEGYQIVKH